VIKSGTGKYLGVADGASDGSSLLAVNEPFKWDIWPDEDNAARCRYLSNLQYVSQSEQ
jgi:hypothetical protein